jgi:hypothetical protein
MEPGMQMLDYTDELMSNSVCFGELSHNMVEHSPFENVTKITLDMLRRRPDITKALTEGMKDLLIEWSNEDEEEPEDFNEKQIVTAINLDPFIGTTVFECLMGMSDLVSEEGDEMYLPSIFDTDNFSEIKETMDNGGFREDKDPIPAKYCHLSSKYQDMIYTNPNVRKIVSNLPATAITETLVESLCS